MIPPNIGTIHQLDATIGQKPLMTAVSALSTTPRVYVTHNTASRRDVINHRDI
ncbi:hypothetical protein HMPREF0970_00162 [Schaalia odontolytica F0309]|uniref:Uncharacterized protein n=1 Tax=Schaalia odontolytica F0309 TaxID=649742 RepID=D4TW54_9ACTO|nr:hypothetical protein HMPREF0970_00162 [Schaalia odontolytica F0309]